MNIHILENSGNVKNQRKKERELIFRPKRDILKIITHNGEFSHKMGYFRKFRRKSRIFGMFA